MAALNKIAANSPSRQSPSELESSLANALFDLESNTQDLKASLRPLQFVSAREVGILCSMNYALLGCVCANLCAFGRATKVASIGEECHKGGTSKDLIGLFSLSNEYGWHKFRTTTEKMQPCWENFR